MEEASQPLAAPEKHLYKNWRQTNILISSPLAQRTHMRSVCTLTSGPCCDYEWIKLSPNTLTDDTHLFHCTASFTSTLLKSSQVVLGQAVVDTAKFALRVCPTMGPSAWLNRSPLASGAQKHRVCRWKSTGQKEYPLKTKGKFRRIIGSANWMYKEKTMSSLFQHT